jgi:hypothetical protein
MAGKPNFTAKLSDKVALSTAAARLGLLQTRGAGAGRAGSIGLLLDRISAGEALVLLHVYDFPEDMRAAAGRIRALAERADHFDQNTLRGLAAALEHAAELKAVIEDQR